jgi:predicted esterase
MIGNEFLILQNYVFGKNKNGYSKYQRNFRANQKGGKLVKCGTRIFKTCYRPFLITLFSLLCCGLYAKPVIVNGDGDFVFEYKLAGQVKKIPVYYFSPQKLSRMSRVVFVLHGVGRNGKVYRDEWRTYAAKYNFIVLCPEFSKTEFPDWWSYNGGNIYDNEKKQYTPRQDWSFNVIEGLFDFVKQDRQLKAEAYCIFGHSAGAQFVQRMVLFMPEARFSLAIANGSGNYTAPTFDKKFTEGVKFTAVTEESLRKSFSKEMIILMGEKDFVSKTMPKSPDAFHEYDRVWKAKLFYDDAKAEAEKRKVDLNWRIKFVPNADHNSHLHAEYGSKLAANSKIFVPKQNPIADEPITIAGEVDPKPADGNSPH